MYNVDNLRLTFAIGNAEKSRGSLSCEALFILQTTSACWMVYLCTGLLKCCTTGWIITELAESR